MALSTGTEQRHALLLFTDLIALELKEIEQKFSDTESVEQSMDNGTDIKAY
jgi:hypothetical protein